MNRVYPIVLGMSLVATGCATTSTLNRPVHLGKPLFMSGTKLDIAALIFGN